MSNVFSVSSTRSIIDSSLFDASGTKPLWNNWILIMINIPIWRIRLGIIPTRDRLSFRGMELYTIMCLTFHNVMDTTDHLFVGCRE